MGYVGLHQHTIFSLLDGYCKIPDLVKRSKELGWTATAITDHNHLGGIPDFQKECKKQDIKPLLGCCLPDQLIYTSEGMKEIQDIKVGDYVLTHNGVYKKVVKHWSRRYNGILYGIKSWNTSTVWLTEEHPILVRSVKRTGNKGSYHWSDSMQWIRADQVTQKRLLADSHDHNEYQRLWQTWITFPKHQERSNVKTLNLTDYLDDYLDDNGFLVKADMSSHCQVRTLIPASVKLTPELMKMFGLFVAKGSYSKEKNGAVCALHFSFHSKEHILRNTVTQTLSQMFNVSIEYHSKEDHKENFTEIIALSVPVAQVFHTMFGEHENNKSFPVWFYTLDLSLQKAFLEGIELGSANIDGHYIYLTLANQKLIYQVRALLANLGITSSISKVVQHRENSTDTVWTLGYTYNKDLEEHYYSDGKYIYMPLRVSKETIQYNGLVYNFTVADDNSYVTDIILHNCEMYYTPNMKLLSAPVDVRNQLAERDAILSGQWTKEDIAALKSTDRTKLHKKFGYDTIGYHILFIAKDQQGWSNLVKLQSESSRLCTFNGRYHCDLKLLRKYHEGIICTTACIGSYPAEMICTKRERFATGYLEAMKQIFGSDFYLEIQPLNIKRQQQTNWFYYKWGKSNGVKTVATNDSHWVNRDDALDHDVLLCIGLYEKLTNPARMHYDPVFWVRSKEEMLSAFDEQANNMVEKIAGFNRETYFDYYQTALNNTQEIADKVDADIRLGSDRHLFPAISVKSTPERTLRDKALIGLNSYLAKNENLNVNVYQKRLTEELDIICSKGFAPYFLAIEELISWCDSVGIPTGPGRGSAAGSLVLFCLGVTKKVDPIEMKLWFSRFMTKDRKDMPDVDCDVSWVSRDKTISHLEEVYGKPCVSHIGTFSTLKVKSALKDVARVLDVPFVEALKITKEIDAIDDDPNLSFNVIDGWQEGTLDERAKYKRFSTLEKQYPDVFSFARKFEGIPRQMGVHASGILVTPMAVSDIFPVRYIDGIAVTLYTGVQVDEFKACKLDILGLKTLDIIDMTLKNIDPDLNIGSLYDIIDIKDSQIYDMIRSKKTDAIFQLESDTMKGIIGTINPTCFEDIVVINSVARPGPLSCNMHIDYAKRKSGEEKISYPIDGCEDILKPTYGIIPYQENLMAISKRVAGFDDTQADSLMRKCIA